MVVVVVEMVVRMKEESKINRIPVDLRFKLRSS
jgi:hypothetical protein